MVLWVEIVDDFGNKRRGEKRIFFFRWKCFLSKDGGDGGKWGEEGDGF